MPGCVGRDLGRLNKLFFLYIHKVTLLFIFTPSHGSLHVWMLDNGWFHSVKGFVLLFLLLLFGSCINPITSHNLLDYYAQELAT